MSPQYEELALLVDFLYDKEHTYRTGELNTVRMLSDMYTAAIMARYVYCSLTGIDRWEVRDDRRANYPTDLDITPLDTELP